MSGICLCSNCAKYSSCCIQIYTWHLISFLSVRFYIFVILFAKFFLLSKVAYRVYLWTFWDFQICWSPSLPYTSTPWPSRSESYRPTFTTASMDLHTSRKGFWLLSLFEFHKHARFKHICWLSNINILYLLEIFGTYIAHSIMEGRKGRTFCPVSILFKSYRIWKLKMRIFIQKNVLTS